MMRHETKHIDNQLLNSSNKENDYFRGLTLGQKQHDREKLLGQLKQSQQSKEKGAIVLLRLLQNG